MYGRDGRCGRIPEPSESGSQQETVSREDDPPGRPISLGKEKDWQCRRYNTFAGCEAVHKVT